MKSFCIIAALWIGLGILNGGFVNADVEHWGDHYGYKHCDDYRSDLAFVLGWSVFLSPVAILITPFVTGFYQHGWRLAPRADCGAPKP